LNESRKTKRKEKKGKERKGKEKKRKGKKRERIMEKWIGGGQIHEKPNFCLYNLKLEKMQDEKKPE